VKINNVPLLKVSCFENPSFAYKKLKVKNIQTVYWILFSLCITLMLLLVYQILALLSILNNPLIANDTVYPILKPSLICVGLSIILSLASLILYLKREINYALMISGCCLTAILTSMIYYH
jgi:hypothetical protein